MVAHNRTKLDPSWHKSRLAALILLKARAGRSLSARDRRLATWLSEEPDVTDRLISQGINFWRAPFTRGSAGELVQRICHVSA